MIRRSGPPGHSQSGWLEISGPTPDGEQIVAAKGLPSAPAGSCAQLTCSPSGRKFGSVLSGWPVAPRELYVGQSGSAQHLAGDSHT